MTTDEVLQAAKEAGFGINHAEASAILFTRFAALVASAEREACAKVCDAKAHEVRLWCNESNVIACAEAIRARGTP